MHGVFPTECKDSIVILRLKKASQDCNAIKNYRLVAKSSVISKILERIVNAQILDHFKINNLAEKFKFAYKTKHNTEIALVRVIKDMLTAINNGNLSLLTMLDFSAAFDTIDPHTFFDRLQIAFGIGFRSSIFRWFKSYLTDKQQFIMEIVYIIERNLYKARCSSGLSSWSVTIQHVHLSSICCN